jgi:integrase
VELAAVPASGPPAPRRRVPDAEQRCDAAGGTLAAAALSSTALINIVAPIMRDAGVPAQHCHPHVLRHTFAALYLQRRKHDSGGLSKLQELLGHASIETTRGYVHHTRDELERSMRAGERSVLDAAAAARERRNGRRVA